jgi:hypothetical protein
MSTRWPGSIINQTAPVPTGGGAGDSAPGVWTFEQAAPYIANQEWPGTGTPDPQFQYVTALLHGDGTNGGQNNTFLDSSSNNFSITRNGNTTQGSFSPYGNLWSNFFNGSNSGLNCTGSALSGQFTMEGWICFTSSFADGTTYFGMSIDNGGFIRQETSSTITFLFAGVAIDLTASFTPVIGVWYHIAVTRNASNVMTIWVNGVSAGSATVTRSYASGTFSVGYNNYSGGATGWFPGYISNVRLVIGVCLYTTNFTPSTTPLTAVSGTQVLTCQSNRFRDNSSNNYTVTPVGTPSVQRFSPFQNLATYQPAVIGGSGYFDGTGDYLSSSVTAIGTNNFTIEYYSYLTAHSGGSGEGGYFQISSTSGGLSTSYTAGVLATRSSSATGRVLNVNVGNTNIATTFVPPLNQWYHTAIVRQSNTVSVYVNGILVSTPATISANLTGSFLALGGYYDTSYLMTGYLSGFRVVNSAVYTAAFTPPAAPPTPITSTGFLTNFTNGAIFDSDATTVLETVGNAQISTSVVKYGTGSMSFNGTNSQLRSPYTFIFGGNFTIEGWFYASSSSTNFPSLLCAATANQFQLQFNSAFTAYYVNFAGSQVINGATLSGVSTNAWNHFAIVRVGSTGTVYFNGLARNTFTSSATVSQTLIIGSDASNSNWWNGNLDELRITQGYARYWFNFQPPTRAFPNYGGTVIELEDPLFQYNTLLLNGNGTNGAQNNTFLDSSTNNFTITRNGNTTQGSFSPYGNLWSNYFTTNNYLTAPANAAFQMGSGDFTIEAWIFPTATAGSSNSEIISYGAPNEFDGWHFLQIASTNVLSFNLNYAGLIVSSSAALALNTWTHVAVTRSGTTFKLWINGVNDGTATSSTSQSTNASDKLYVGTGSYSQGADRSFIGYISNARVVKNSVVYSSTFTPSTTPLTAITNTSVLTCQSNRFIDNSSNNFTITANGSPSVQRFSPFNPTAPYSTSVIGGSGYFDGSGDYLTAPDNAAFDYGSGDFTLECWILPTATNNSVLLTAHTSGSDFGPCNLFFSSGALQLYSSSNNSSFDVANGASVGTPPVGQWSHVAVSRSGTSIRCFLNGVLTSTTTSSATLMDATGTFQIAARNGSLFYTGYVSNFRVVKGTAVYTSAFTPPTAPLTAISGTSLLTNFTNAGIPDLAMMNNLETVGNAQVSTAQSKFGGSSLLFDGTGDSLVTRNILPTQLQTGDFTIECWAYFNSVSSGTILDKRNGTTRGILIYFPSSGNLNLAAGDSNASAFEITFTKSGITTSTWYHIAFVRSGSNFYAFVDGAQISASQSSSMTIDDAAANFYIGAFNDGSEALNGYIQDFRITKIARYVQPFTPPTQAFQTY